jgi:hypothetical protein
VWVTEHPDVANGQRYIVSAGENSPQAIADILRKHYPELKIDQGKPGQGYEPDYQFPADGIRIDGSKVVKASGLKYNSLEKAVLDTAEVLKRLL